MTKIQSEVEQDLLNGAHHSVGTIYARWHTHDGRKILSRIRQKWARLVPPKVMDDYLEEDPVGGAMYKVFFLEKEDLYRHPTAKNQEYLIGAV